MDALIYYATEKAALSKIVKMSFILNIGDEK